MNNEDMPIEKHRNRKKWVRWAPNLDTGIAFASLSLMVLAYYAAIHWLVSRVSVILVLGILTNIFLNVVLPVWWIVYHRKQPLSELGITTNRWLTSLLISIGIGGFTAIRLYQMASGINWLPHILLNIACFWEPFFVYGWLQLRFDRAFGIIPGIILAGLSFTAYHIGTYPPNALLMFLFVGMLYGAVFRITSNLLIIWPLAFPIGSAIGTLMGGMEFTWDHVTIWSIILAAQLIFIGYTWRRQRRRYQHKE